MEQQAYIPDNVEDFPTEEELATLRRVPDHIPIKAYTIAFVELVERLSYYGTTQVGNSSSLPTMFAGRPWFNRAKF